MSSPPLPPPLPLLPLLLTLCLGAAATSTATVTATDWAVDRWIDCVLASAPPSRPLDRFASIANAPDQLSASPRPFYLGTFDRLGLLRKPVTLGALVVAHGAEMAKWQFGGSGTYDLPPLWRTGLSENFLPFADAVAAMDEQIDRRRRHRATARTPGDNPMWARGAAAAEDPCDAEFRAACTLDETPLYAISSSAGLMVRHHFNETTQDMEPIDWDRIPEAGLVDKMVGDGIILRKLPDRVLQAEAEGVDLYFSTAFSGSHFHTHGSAIASGTGRKLWLLVSPELQCKWAAHPELLRKSASLPPICDETRDDWGPHSKYHHKSKRCLGQLHPLDIVRRLGVLGEHGLAPELVLQQAGEVMVVPERWMHATVNLDDNAIAISYRYERSKPYHLGCRAGEEEEEEEEKEKEEKIAEGEEL